MRKIHATGLAVGLFMALAVPAEAGTRYCTLYSDESNPTGSGVIYFNGHSRCDSTITYTYLSATIYYCRSYSDCNTSGSSISNSGSYATSVDTDTRSITGANGLYKIVTRADYTPPGGDVVAGGYGTTCLPYYDAENRRHCWHEEFLWTQ